MSFASNDQVSLQSSRPQTQKRRVRKTDASLSPKAQPLNKGERALLTGNSQARPERAMTERQILTQQTPSSGPKKSYAREITALFLVFWAIFLVLSLISFDKNDPTLNHVKSVGEIRNKAGLFGAYVAGFLNEWFGLCSFVWPVFFISIAVPCVSQRYVLDWRRWLGCFLLVLFVLETGVAWDLHAGHFSPGGICGHGLYETTTRLLNPIGASLFWLFVFMIAVQLILSISWFDQFGRVAAFLRGLIARRRERRAAASGAAFLQKEERAGLLDLLIGLGRGCIGLCGSLWAKKTPKEAPQPLIIDIARRDVGRPNVAEKPLQPVLLEPHGSDELFEPEETLYKESLTEDEDLLHLDEPAKKESEKKEPEKESREESGPKAAEEKVLPQEAALEERKESESACKELKEEAAQPSNEQVEAAPAAKGKLSGFLQNVQNFFSSEAEEELQPQKAPLPRKEYKDAVYPLPPLDLLTPPEKGAGADTAALQEKGAVLIQTLGEFSIEGELVAITPGPVVTLFEVRPASGVRVSKFMSISDDLARVLKAVAVRILAPVPGSDTVGIEIPNERREMVNFREIAATEAFTQAASPLTMVLGKDTAGRPVLADLARMPHMLVAGATGTGKSVCLNSILASFLYRTQPKDLKLLLIDPKRVEMSIYADEPHLIHPVVNESQDAKSALEWATHEMDARFKAMAKLGVRNIANFNKRLASFGENRPEEFQDLEPLPYIAIIIDELADLMMMSDRKDVENSIVRLAQLARACGIHMILATQRPSVDVVTGIIKANFPCRISFQVSSSADSRTILDTVGAEKLLGRGDMLFRPGDTSLQRLHGAFLSDEEVARIVAHWKSQTTPNYKVDFANWNGGSGAGTGGGAAQADHDDLYDEVLSFVREEGVASISKIQRRFKIGFNRAARLVDALEAKGILEPAEGSKPRKVRR